MKRAGIVHFISMIFIVAAVHIPSVRSAAQSGTPLPSAPESCLSLDRYEVPAGHHPHDVAPAADGQRVWYTAQRAGALGLLDPETGSVETIPLGEGFPRTV